MCSREWVGLAAAHVRARSICAGKRELSRAEPGPPPCASAQSLRHDASMAESSASSGSVRLPEVPEKPQEAAVGQAEGVRQGCQAKGGFCASPRTCGYQAVSSGASEQHEGLTCESLTEELDIEELAKKYKTNLKKGLTGKKAAEACASRSSFTFSRPVPRPQTRQVPNAALPSRWLYYPT